jgi:hypothetical protein
MEKKLTKAEKAVLELSELNKLVFALREAGRKSGKWEPERGVVREGAGPRWKRGTR